MPTPDEPGLSPAAHEHSRKLQHALRALIISTVLAVLLYGTFAIGLDGEGVAAAIGQVTLVTWLSILALSLVNYLLRFFRWHLYLASCQLSPPVLPSLLIYFFGFAFTTTPAKAGEAIRSYYLKDLGVPYFRSLSALLVERILDLLAIILLSSLVLIGYGAYGPTILIPLVIVLAVLLFLHHPQFLSLFTAVQKRLGENSKAGWLVAKIATTFASSKEFTQGRLFYQGFALGLLAWAAEAFALWLIVRDLGGDLSVWLVMGVYSISVLAGAVSFVPGGLGTTEAAMGFLLYSSGMPASQALAATLVCRIATLWFAVALGAVAFLGLELPPFSIRKSASQQPYSKK